MITVVGTISDLRLPEASASRSGGQQYTSFVIDPDTGPALRAGAAGDLRRDPNVPESLVDPACEGKVRARFKVGRVFYTAAFDYGVFSVQVVRDSCRG